MTITLPDNSSIADWHVTAKTNGKPALWIKELQFPRLENVASLGNDRLVYGHHLGRMVRSPGKRIGLTHIVSPGEWSMQFAAFFGSPSTPPDQFKSNEVIGYQRGIASDETGLFIAADDERHYHKVMHAERKPELSGFSVLAGGFRETFRQIHLFHAVQNQTRHFQRRCR